MVRPVVLAAAEPATCGARRPRARARRPSGLQSSAAAARPPAVPPWSLSLIEGAATEAGFAAPDPPGSGSTYHGYTYCDRPGPATCDVRIASDGHCISAVPRRFVRECKPAVELPPDAPVVQAPRCAHCAPHACRTRFATLALI